VAIAGTGSCFFGLNAEGVLLLLQVCFGFFLMLGTVGWRASLMFVRRIYQVSRQSCGFSCLAGALQHACMGRAAALSTVHLWCRHSNARVCKVLYHAQSAGLHHVVLLTLRPVHLQHTQCATLPLFASGNQVRVSMLNWAPAAAGHRLRKAPRNGLVSG
jgi:hypothetical protein